MLGHVLVHCPYLTILVQIAILLVRCNFSKLEHDYNIYGYKTSRDASLLSTEIFEKCSQPIQFPGGMGAESVANGNVESGSAAESTPTVETRVSLTNDKPEEMSASAEESVAGIKEELVLEVFTSAGTGTDQISEEKLCEKLVVEIFTEKKALSEDNFVKAGIEKADKEPENKNVDEPICTDKKKEVVEEAEDATVEKNIEESDTAEKKNEELPVVQEPEESALSDKKTEDCVSKPAADVRQRKAAVLADINKTENTEKPAAKFSQVEALPIPKQGATQRRKSTFIKPADKFSAERNLESFFSGKRPGSRPLGGKILEEPIKEQEKLPSEPSSESDEADELPSEKFKRQEPLPIPKQGATQRRKSTFIKPSDKSTAERNLESFLSAKGPGLRSRFSAIREEDDNQSLSIRRSLVSPRPSPRSSPRPSPRSSPRPSPRPSPRTSPRSSPTPRQKFGADRFMASKNESKKPEPIKREPGKFMPNKLTSTANKFSVKTKEVVKPKEETASSKKAIPVKLPVVNWADVDEKDTGGRDVVRVFDHSETGMNIELGESHLEHQIKSLRDQRRGVDDDKQDPFMGLNLGVIKSRMAWWRDHLPQLEPCADCMMISGLTPVNKVLNGAGCWFYALSKKELKDLIDIGVDPQKIIFGQTVKQEAHLQYAKAHNIGYVAFDSAFELHKIRKDYKDAKLLIRACLTEPDQPIPKYGRNIQSCQDILNTARMLGLQVAGVISVLRDTSTQKDIKETCTMIRNIFQYANKSLNYKMNVVMAKFNIDRDLSEEEGFVELAEGLNRNFLTSFKNVWGTPGNKDLSSIKIVVDPGEFFVKDSVSLAASIIGVRRLGSKDNRKVYYYVNESIYQSFAHARIKPGVRFIPKVLFYTSKIKSQKGEVEATVYGYSDDEADCLSRGCELPVDMCNGDMLAFYGMGPYVKSFESDWMINNAVVYYFCLTEDVSKLLEWVPKAVHNEDKGTMYI